MNAASKSWPRAILFDFDGVIVNSEPLHFFAFTEILKAEHIELTEAEYYEQLIGFDDRGALRHVYETRSLPLEPKTLLRLMTRKIEVMRALMRSRQIQALPGVEQLVRGLWRHYPLAICSGALREEIEAMLESVRLRDCFPTIVAAEDVEIGKPNPMGYLKATALVGERINAILKPADCLIVEDAPTVCKTTRAAGFSVLAVATSYKIEQLFDANWAVKTLEPDNVLAKIPELRVQP